jgi:hypothetical protein
VIFGAALPRNWWPPKRLHATAGRLVTYGKADVQTADRAMIYVEREKRRQYHLIE